jgi:hypothetical protein
MKNFLSRMRLLPVLGSAWALAFSAAAQSDSTAQADTAAKLPYGVADVLKLSHAQVSEDVISSYIQNSGTVYNLAPSDIVYLKEQGVSDRIVNQMLDQRKRVAEASSQVASTASQAQPAYNYSAPSAPAPTYVQPAVSYVPSSTVYTIPYPDATYAYYGYGYRPYYYGSYYGSYCGPYWGGYYGWGFPAVSFGFGFGHHDHFGGHFGGHGGFHGGFGGGHHR